MDGGIVISQKTTYKGKFATANVEGIIDAATDQLLHRVGRIGADKMKAYTRPHDWKGRLTDSITWRTSKDRGTVGGAAKAEDVISAPPQYSVDMGSACEYAWWREHGSGAHVSSYKHEEFIANMREWFNDKVAPLSPDTEALFWDIVNSVRQGVDAVPFCAPALGSIISAARSASRLAGFERNLR